MDKRTELCLVSTAFPHAPNPGLKLTRDKLFCQMPAWSPCHPPVIPLGHLDAVVPIPSTLNPPCLSPLSQNLCRQCVTRTLHVSTQLSPNTSHPSMDLYLASRPFHGWLALLVHEKQIVYWTTFEDMLRQCEAEPYLYCGGTVTEISPVGKSSALTMCVSSY